MTLSMRIGKGSSHLTSKLPVSWLLCSILPPLQSIIIYSLFKQPTLQSFIPSKNYFSPWYHSDFLTIAFLTPILPSPIYSSLSYNIPLLQVPHHPTNNSPTHNTCVTPEIVDSSKYFKSLPNKNYICNTIYWFYQLLYSTSSLKLFSCITTSPSIFTNTIVPSLHPISYLLIFKWVISNDPFFL